MFAAKCLARRWSRSRWMSRPGRRFSAKDGQQGTSSAGLKTNFARGFVTGTVGLCGLLGGLVSGQAQAQANVAKDASQRPNIVLILSDDMGYSDLGCFGGEIRTPNLDRLASEGVRFLQSYNAGRCCPTRASLMTGMHPHQVGIGHMTNAPGNNNGDFGNDAYRGVLSQDAPTMAEALHDAGYATFMAGKWHLGMDNESQLPLQRGFDRFYGIPAGATNFFKPFGQRCVYEGNTPIETGEGYYFTDALGSKAIEFIQDADQANDEQPFFLYLAFTSPHWPIQALKEDIDRYRDRYKGGWETLRQERFARMQAMGLIDEGWDLTPLDGKPWEKVPAAKQEEMALRMAIYAAMVDRMDQNIGRLMEALEASGEMDNTLIVFLNDNGACAEGGPMGGGPAKQLETLEGYFLTYGQHWANASNTPYRLYKHYTHEGGIATPTIVHWPAGMHGQPAIGGFNKQPVYLPDWMPTFLDLAQAKDQPDMRGVSLVETIQTNKPLAHRQMYWEHEGHGALREGKWKLVRRHDGPNTPWELYNMDQDRTEMHDLAKDPAQQTRLKNMAGAWQTWADSVGVLPWIGERRMWQAARDAEAKAKADAND